MINIIKKYKSFNFLKKKSILGIYDLEKINCSFDFFTFYQNLFHYAKTQNIKTVDICILAGLTNDFKKEQFGREKQNSLGYANSRLSNIVIPSLNLFEKKVNNFYYIKDRKKILEIIENYYSIFPPNYSLNSHKRELLKYIWWSNLESSSRKVELVKIKPNLLVEKYIKKNLAKSKRTITITLREGSYKKFLNSNLSEWKKFINYLKKKNYQIIVIRDFEKIGKRDFFKKYEKFPHASYDLSVRISLYKNTFINLGVTNGPTIINWINSYKTILWKCGEKFSPGYEENTGLVPFKKSNILTKNMRHVFENDSFNNLKKYFNLTVKK